MPELSRLGDLPEPVPREARGRERMRDVSYPENSR